jgi:predicted nuclease of restriction endonuclease-like (RecB) superfamily
MPNIAALNLYQRVKGILAAARTNAARTVNSAHVASNWLIGREIFEEEQQGRQRAVYRERALKKLSERLEAEFGGGYSFANLKFMRQFYMAYPSLLNAGQIGYALRSLFVDSGNRPNAAPPINSTFEGNSWEPGRASPNLAWGHYRALMRVDNIAARSFYEVESLNSNWSARELERQIASLLYERLAKTRNKAGLMRLAAKGAKPRKPIEIFKDPPIIEFLGLPESPALTETSLESALITNLQAFLLELGSGFAFVARQQRVTLDGDHFYIDLVFYHSVLKCFVLVDLKVGKLTHGDLGQLQLYVNFYDLERRALDDNPTLGLILCSDKNDAVVKYTLGPNQEEKIFASRYRLHLPSEADLRAQLQARRDRT